MRLNIFHYFLTRLIATFLLVTALATTGIYWYFQQQAVGIFQTLVDEETARFDKATIGLDWEQEAHRPLFMQAFEELAQRRGFAELLITYIDGDEIFRYNRSDGKPMLTPGFNLDFPSEMGDMNHRLIRQDSHYLLLFSVYPRSVKGKAIIWGMLPMDNAFAAQIEGSALLAITVVLITASLIGITTLPLVRHAYKKIEQRWRELQRSYLATTQALGRAISTRDNETSRHNFRVAYYALRLGEEIGLDRGSMRSLILGAFLHDLGKIGIPDHILLKPGRLDAEEQKIMQGHVLLGLEIIEDIDWLCQAKTVISSHHERFDGDGYPHRLSGEKIPIEARVFAVVDVFDALTNERPYKPAFSIEDALSHLMESSGSHFDSTVVAAFITIAPTLHYEIANLNERRLQTRLQQAAARHFPEQSIR